MSVNYYDTANYAIGQQQKEQSQPQTYGQSTAGGNWWDTALQAWEWHDQRKRNKENDKRMDEMNRPPEYALRPDLVDQDEKKKRDASFNLAMQNPYGELLAGMAPDWMEHFGGGSRSKDEKGLIQYDAPEGPFATPDRKAVWRDLFSNFANAGKKAAGLTEGGGDGPSKIPFGDLKISTGDYTPEGDQWNIGAMGQEGPTGSYMPDGKGGYTFTEYDNAEMTWEEIVAQREKQAEAVMKYGGVGSRLGGGGFRQDQSEGGDIGYIEGGGSGHIDPGTSRFSKYGDGIGGRDEFGNRNEQYNTMSPTMQEAIDRYNQWTDGLSDEEYKAEMESQKKLEGKIIGGLKALGKEVLVPALRGLAAGATGGLSELGLMLADKLGFDPLQITPETDANGKVTGFSVGEDIVRGGMNFFFGPQGDLVYRIGNSLGTAVKKGYFGEKPGKG